MALKIVDKYEFQEESGHMEDGVEIIPARHTALRQPFTLKKLNLKEGSTIKHGNLANQFLMLKELSGDWVIQCHKMLKTTNNLYLVYDQIIPTNTLAYRIQNSKQTISKEMKESIAGQLISILQELKYKGMVNMNITPKTIELFGAQLPGRNKTVRIRLNSFEYAIMLKHVLDPNIIKNLPVSQFTPPEMDLLPPNLGNHCDIYSAGKVLQMLDFGNDQTSSQDAIRIRQLISLIDRMTVKDHRKRITSEEILPFFQGKALELPSRQIQRSKTLTNASKLQPNDPTARISRKLTNTLTTQDSYPQRERQNSHFRAYCLKILKRRNLSIFLLKCCQNCSKSTLADMDSIMKTSFLFLKSSTHVIAQLSKFLATGHDHHIKIPQRELNAFFKTQDYFQLQSQIAREMSLSRKYLNVMVSKITTSFSNLLEQEDFARQTSQEKINEEYLKTTLMSFLSESMKSPRVGREDKKVLDCFLIMSYLFDFGSYERMFEELISEDTVELQSQSLLAKIAQLSLDEVISKIRAVRSLKL